ncbi:site-specific integrase [Colwellia sp. MEBiC06753]
MEDECILPFTQRELNKLLNTVHISQTKRMIFILAWTGLRPGELKALSWEDVNLEKGYLRIKYNIDRQGKLKPPKTEAGHRKVELLPEVISIFREQMNDSFNNELREETVFYKNHKIERVKRRRVFLSRGGEPYKRPELTTAPKQWFRWLKEAGLEYRPPYQLRHTYASQMLMIGANHAWLAKQMGHSNWGLIQKIYAKWIENENPNYILQLTKDLNIKFPTN